MKRLERLQALTQRTIKQVIHGHDLQRSERGGGKDKKHQQRLQRIKTKTSLIVSFTSQMVALIRLFRGGVVPWRHSAEQAFATFNYPPALCCDFQTSASLLYHPGSMRSETIVKLSLFSGALSFWFWILWVGFLWGFFVLLSLSPHRLLAVIFALLKIRLGRRRRCFCCL